MTPEQSSHEGSNLFQRLANTRVGNVLSLLVAAWIVASVFWGGGKPDSMTGWPLVTVNIGKLLLAAFLIVHSVRSMFGRASGTAAKQGQKG